MKTKLDSILLIDDDNATNFVHKFILKKTECAKNIVITENGQEALEYLHSKENETAPKPNIIFLDINMPSIEILLHF